MCKSYRQLACDERCPIKALKSRGISLREIADQLDRSPATISRDCPQADRCVVASHPCPAGSGLESGADRGSPEASGRGDDRSGVDLPAGAAGMPAGAAFRAGWTSPSVPRWWRRGAGSGTGSWTRSSAPGTAGPCSPRWTGCRSTRCWSCWPARPRCR